MKRIGLTGGIGSGKTVVSQLFRVFEIPVYDSDERSKVLCQTNSFLKESLIQWLGKDVYLEDGTLNRAQMAQKLFADPDLVRKANGLIHPAVIEDFVAWSEQQTAAFVLLESAILYEANLAHLFDAVVVVTAPEDVRIRRVCSRSNLSQEQVKERMSHQLSEPELIKRSDYRIINDGVMPLIPQVVSLMDNLG